MVKTPRALPLQPDILLSRICMILQMVNISCSSCLTIYLLHIIKSLIDGRLVVLEMKLLIGLMHFFFKLLQNAHNI